MDTEYGYSVSITATADVRTIIQTRRIAIMSTPQEFVRAKRASVESPAQRPVVDSMIFQAEAEQCRLDHCEAVLTATTEPPASLEVR